MTSPAIPSLPRPVAVLFDVYDTLFLNSHDEWVGTFARICKEQRLSIEPRELWTRWKKHEVRFRQVRTNLEDPSASPPFKTYERAWMECFTRVFQEGGLKGDAQLAARRSVEDMARRRIFPDAASALTALSGRGLKLGVFSNADDAFVLPLLKASGLRFDFIASSESAKVYKPARAAFEHILKSMSLDASKAWYVGDQLYDDVLGAGSVGMTTVWINRIGASPSRGEPRPDATIEDLRQLAALFDRSAQGTGG